MQKLAVSVDQVGSNVGVGVDFDTAAAMIACPSIRLVPTSESRMQAWLVRQPKGCPSIRLVPTSESLSRCGN